MRLGIAGHHLAYVHAHLHGVQHAQGVGQHIAFDGGVLQAVHQGKDIVGRVLYTVGPVLQVDIHIDSLLRGVCHHAAYVADMLVHRLAQLPFAMTSGAFAQEVQVAASCAQEPVHRGCAVAEAQNLYPVYLAGPFRPLADAGHGLFLSLADTCRSHLYAIHAHPFQQGACNHQFLVGHERDTTGLLSIAQSGVHYFYGTGFHHLLMDLDHRLD